MTEAEWSVWWLACDDPKHMVERIGTHASERRLRLFACACCYRVYSEEQNVDELSSVEVAERFADGLATAEELQLAEEDMDCGDYRYSPADYVCSRDIGAVVGTPAAASGLVEYNAARRQTEPSLVERLERVAQSHLVRDIFGNPFRPMPAIDRKWLTSTVVALAKGMYESRDFGAMPILADALQDAGCDSDDILDHCRGDGPHARGCWVVDLILGKE
jgi:hypothetical protein